MNKKMHGKCLVLIEVAMIFSGIALLVSRLDPVTGLLFLSFGLAFFLCTIAITDFSTWTPKKPAPP